MSFTVMTHKLRFLKLIVDALSIVYVEMFEFMGPGHYRHF